MPDQCTAGYRTTAGKTYNDINPRAEGVSNTTTFGLFKIEWESDPDWADGGAVITDPDERLSGDVKNGRFVDENEMSTGSKLDDANSALRPVDRPDYDSTVLEVGDVLSVAFPVRAAETGLPQVYKNLDESTTTATNADGTPNTQGLEPAYFPRMGEYYYTAYHNCDNTTYGAGNFQMFPGAGNANFGLSGNLSNASANRVQTQNVLMDMDALLHESAFTADKPKHVDTYEMFAKSYSFIPGSANNSTGDDYNSRTRGNNNIFMDADALTASNRQKISYVLTGTPTTGTVNDAVNGLPNQYTYVTTGQSSTGYTRDYFRYVTASRIADALSTLSNGGNATATQDLNVVTAATGTVTAGEGEAAHDVSGAQALSATPLIWSQTRLHMQKAWLATTSEMVSDYDDGVGTANADDDYQAARKYSEEATLYTGANAGVSATLPGADPNFNDYHKMIRGNGQNNLMKNQYDNREIEFGQYEDALELGQEFTSQLTAYNYGDRNLDGVEFTYIMPRGVEPVLDADGHVVLDAELLKKVNGVSNGRGDAVRPSPPTWWTWRSSRPPTGTTRAMTPRAPSRTRRSTARAT